MSRRKQCRTAEVQPSSKRDAILLAAKQVFLEMGYAAASMDTVAARAGVSKATIYAHFESKTALFGWVIRSRCDQQFGDLCMPDVAAGDARTVLRSAAQRLLDLLLSPEGLAIYRVVVAEAHRLPELAEAFYAAGPRVGKATLAAMFSELDRRGLLKVDDSELASDMFVGMLKGDLHMRGLLNLGACGRSREEVVDKVVEILCAAYRV
ncbi:MAG: TetR/AcrR family transcriptional regulator [Rhodospirillales bacterium]|nr:TetR/AcrR family transcriptional regulator [Rhodospirillales bacterium]